MTTHPTPPTQPPRARPAAVGVAVVLALALVGVAVVAVHDLAVAQDWARGGQWTSAVVDALDGLTADDGVVVAGVVAVVAGLLVLALALKPARRTHLPVAADADVWASPGAVAALARAVADRAPGVISSEATRVTRRRVTVEVVTQQDGDSVVEGVRAALAETVADLTPARITVRASEVPR